jgi:hypothetical protein
VAQDGDAGGDRDQGQAEPEQQVAELAVRQQEAGQHLARDQQGGREDEPLELLALDPAGAAEPHHHRGRRRGHAADQDRQQHGAEQAVLGIGDALDPDRVGEGVGLVLEPQGGLEGVQDGHGHDPGRPRHRKRAPAGRGQPPGGEQQQGEDQDEAEHGQPPPLEPCRQGRSGPGARAGDESVLAVLQGEHAGGGEQADG